MVLAPGVVVVGDEEVFEVLGTHVQIEIVFNVLEEILFDVVGPVESIADLELGLLGPPFLGEEYQAGMEVVYFEPVLLVVGVSLESTANHVEHYGGGVVASLEESLFEFEVEVGGEVFVVRDDGLRSGTSVGDLFDLLVLQLDDVGMSDFVDLFEEVDLILERVVVEMESFEDHLKRVSRSLDNCKLSDVYIVNWLRLHDY